MQFIMDQWASITSVVCPESENYVFKLRTSFKLLIESSTLFLSYFCYNLTFVDYLSLIGIKIKS